MSKQAVTLRIALESGWDAGDRVQIYTDFGTGTIDTGKPLRPRSVEVFPGQQPARPYGSQPYGLGRHGDGKAARPRRGTGATLYGVTPYGTAPPFIEVTVDVPAVLGGWKFAAEVIDRLGHVQAGALQEIAVTVSGTDPAPLAAFAFGSYDDVADQATFTFERN